jgi:N4-gp56 family major capsid protein
MGQVMNNTTLMSGVLNNYYDRNLLEPAKAMLVHTNFGQVRDIPQNQGTKVIKFRRRALLPSATTPLVEGVTPVAGQSSPTDITAEVKQYGYYIPVTDVLLWTGPDAELTRVGMELGEQAGRSLDEICRDIINAGTNKIYPSTYTTRVQITSSDKISTTLLDKAIRELKNNNAKKITSMVAPDQGYATTPLNSCYVGIVHPNMSYDLPAIASGWKPVEQYFRNTAVMPSEIGAYKEIRFVETTQAKVFTGEGAGGTVDVYTALILGSDAYGISRISGKAMENIIKPLGAGEDPLNQRATSGWKAMFTAKILNDDFMVRVESAVSA